MTLPSAVELLNAADHHRHVLPPERQRGTSLAQAESIQQQIATRRETRGEKRRGYKIGFTNRSIWPLYNVNHPIWGPVWDSTLRLLDDAAADIEAAAYVEPRLEPEIVFALCASPATAELPDVLAAIDWVAHGFEIVQSVYPGWQFSAAEAVAAQALHGALLVGPRLPIATLADPAATLASLRLVLSEGSNEIAAGHGAAVLDGPVQALAHLVTEMGQRGQRLLAGDIVTTGTLTDAQPLAAGQCWTTRIEGAPLAGMRLTVS